jgi:hypothetical protein
MIPLISCRDCGSKLLQLERAWLLHDGSRIADRHCPECGMRDSVEIGGFALRLWLTREARLSEQLEQQVLALKADSTVVFAL